ncbi:MAG: sensor histidine kinase [Fimbriiglobus sp.]
MSGLVAGRSAVALPWVCPTAEALLTLTDPQPRRQTLETDLAFLAHMARFSRPSLIPDADPWRRAYLMQAHLPSSAGNLLDTAHHRKMIVHSVLPRGLRHVVEKAGQLAELVAEEQHYVAPAMANFVTRLAFLGWSVVGVKQAELCLNQPDHWQTPVSYQAKHFGMTIPAILVRLATRWQFPHWLSAIYSGLRLPASDAADLGAPIDLFRIVQSTLAVVEQGEMPLGFVDAMPNVDRESEELFLTAAKLWPQVTANTTVVTAHSPKPVELFVRLLRSTAQARRHELAGPLAVAEERIEKLTELLSELRQDFEHELRDAKLAGLAEFAAGAGHEINNPLAVISGNAQLALAKESDTDKQKSLQAIIRQTKRIHEIITGTRQFARPPQPAFETFDVARWLTLAIDGMQGEAESRHVELNLDLNMLLNGVLAHGDPVQLRQALTHLLQNALEASPKGGWVHVSAEAVQQGIRVIIDDSGAGPNEEHLPHLFDPFFSGRSAGRGRGIGLSVAWRLAQLNHGDVRYTPRADGKTRFTMTLQRQTTELDLLPLRQSA